MQNYPDKWEIWNQGEARAASSKAFDKGFGFRMREKSTGSGSLFNQNKVVLSPLNESNE